MLRKLVELGQSSESASAFEAAALSLLQREVGFDLAYFSVKGDEACPTVVAIEPPIVKRAIARGAVYLNELQPVKRAALAGRGVAVDTEVLGLQRLRKTRYFRELSAAAGIQHSLMAYVRWRNDVVAAVMLGRSSAFSASDLRRIESALPALGLGRAAFSLPWVSAPLRDAREPTLLARLGLERQSRPLDSVCTPSGKLVVQDRRGFREMVASEGDSKLVWTRAGLKDPSASGWPYIELFHVAAGLAKRRRRALFVGCGGGVVLRQFASVYPGITLDVVEREPAVIELARCWYDLDSIPGLTVHIADGIDFIAGAASGSWDVVVIDAYDTSTLAHDFTRRAFFADLQRVLSPGGAMAINLIGTLDGYGPLPAVTRAVRAGFSDVRVVPVMGADQDYAPSALRNIVVVATTR